MKNKKECKYNYLMAMLGEIKPTPEIKSSIVEFLLAIIIGIFLGAWVSYNDNAVITFIESVELINNVMIAFIAMEMGAYALFQALLSSELVYSLYKHDSKMLKKSNRSFLGVILLFWICIMINILLLIVMRVVKVDWCLTSNSVINNIICSFFLAFYYAFNFRVMFEVRNYAINLYKVFEAHNLVLLIKGTSDHEDKENEGPQD